MSVHRTVPHGTVSITAPSRLHFGLLSFGHDNVKASRQWGGAGVMIDEPACRLTVSAADRFAVRGPAADEVTRRRIVDFTGRWARSYQKDLPKCAIYARTVAPSHVGLGSGTQLALSVAAVLNRWSGHDTDGIAQLAGRVGRGLRSAVGAHGFQAGGMIIESGKLCRNELGQLERRCKVPQAWRFLLVRPTGEQGCHGPDERRAFADLPSVPVATKRRLRDVLTREILPAVAGGDFSRFADNLYYYGVLAGSCFATVQGGSFATPKLADWVKQIRDLGGTGVGQSSWGPTLFVASPNATSAQKLALDLRAEFGPDEAELSVVGANNSGAQLSVSTGDQRIETTGALARK